MPIRFRRSSGGGVRVMQLARRRALLQHGLRQGSPVPEADMARRNPQVLEEGAVGAEPTAELPTTGHLGEISALWKADATSLARPLEPWQKSCLRFYPDVRGS